MTNLHVFLLMAAIFIAPHTTESVARIGAVLMLVMTIVAALVENMK